MRQFILALGLSFLFLACGTSEPEPLPACDVVCPHQETCTSGEGWSCPATGEECQTLKPCPGATPDCSVVCPEDATCVDGEWTCYGRVDLVCASPESCPEAL